MKTPSLSDGHKEELPGEHRGQHSSVRVCRTCVILNPSDFRAVHYCSINQPIQTDSEGSVVTTQEYLLEAKVQNVAGLLEGTRTRAYQAACLPLTCVPPYVWASVSLFLPPDLHCWLPLSVSVSISLCGSLSSISLPVHICDKSLSHTHTHHYLVSFPNYQGRDSNQLHLLSGDHTGPIKYVQGVKERKYLSMREAFKVT